MGRVGSRFCCILLMISIHCMYLINGRIYQKNDCDRYCHKIGSVKVMFYDPSFEPRQPICCRMPARGRMIVSHAHEGQGLEEVDGGGDEEVMKMALMWEEHDPNGGRENLKVRLLFHMFYLIQLPCLS